MIIKLNSLILNIFFLLMYSFLVLISISLCVTSSYASVHPSLDESFFYLDRSFFNYQLELELELEQEQALHLIDEIKKDPNDIKSQFKLNCLLRNNPELVEDIFNSYNGQKNSPEALKIALYCNIGSKDDQRLQNLITKIPEPTLRKNIRTYLKYNHVTVKFIEHTRAHECGYHRRSSPYDGIITLSLRQHKIEQQLSLIHELVHDILQTTTIFKDLIVPLGLSRATTTIATAYRFDYNKAKTAYNEAQAAYNKALKSHNPLELKQAKTKLTKRFEDLQKIMTLTMPCHYVATDDDYHPDGNFDIKRGSDSSIQEELLAETIAHCARYSLRNRPPYLEHCFRVYDEFNQQLKNYLTKRQQTPSKPAFF